MSVVICMGAGATMPNDRPGGGVGGGVAVKRAMACAGDAVAMPSDAGGGIVALGAVDCAGGLASLCVVACDGYGVAMPSDTGGGIVPCGALDCAGGVAVLGVVACVGDGVAMPGDDAGGIASSGVLVCATTSVGTHSPGGCVVVLEGCPNPGGAFAGVWSRPLRTSRHVVCGGGRVSVCTPGGGCNGTPHADTDSGHGNNGRMSTLNLHVCAPASS